MANTPPNYLRYPLTMIDDSTDYLEISVKEYTRSKKNDLLSTGVSGGLYDTFRILTKGIQQVKAVIYLPMPSTIQDGNSVGYGDDSLDTLTAKLATSALDTMNTNYDTSGGSAGFQRFLTNLGTKVGQHASSILGDPAVKDIAMTNLAASAANIFGNITPNQIYARQSGKILNPNTELLFNGVNLRSFKFSFKMTPRDENESDEIKSIIRTFKLAMAPKPGGYFLNAPEVFDLSYKQGGGKHPFLHKFKTCALTDMSVNYTAENTYATYYDATPVSMIMDLTFKELVPIYQLDYEKSGTTVGF